MVIFRFSLVRLRTYMKGPSMKIIKKLLRPAYRLFIRAKNSIPKNLHKNAPAQLHDFTSMGGVFFDDPSAIIESLNLNPKNPLLEKGEIYPLFFDSNPKTLDLLHLLIKERRPKVVVETGVANGASTRKILSSFSEFGLVESKLYSLDIDPRVATPELLQNSQFNFVLVDTPESFVEAIRNIGSIDFFYHDSDHSYKHQMLEYSESWLLLNPESGVLVSDDVNWSNAFLDFCKKVNRIPILLSDGSTFSGVISK